MEGGRYITSNAKALNPKLLFLVLRRHLAVRQHLVDVAGIRRMNLLHFLQAPHPVGFFGAQQVALAGMHTHDFSGRRDLEALGRAAMCLELKLLHLFCHKRFLSKFCPVRQA